MLSMEQRDFRNLVPELRHQLRQARLDERSDLIIEFIHRYGVHELLEDVVDKHWRDLEESRD